MVESENQNFSVMPKKGDWSGGKYITIPGCSRDPQNYKLENV